MTTARRSYVFGWVSGWLAALLAAPSCGARSELALTDGTFDAGRDSASEDAGTGAYDGSKEDSGAVASRDGSSPDDAPADDAPGGADTSAPDALVCDTTSCAGCCGADGRCQGGHSPSACGTHGAVCSVCEMGTECANGECVALPPATVALVLFGGVGDNDLLSDTWVWQDGTWTQYEVTGPSKRTGHAMASLGASALVFGGVTGADAMSAPVALGDTWSWDGEAWTQVASSGPTPRGDAAMAALGGKVVLFGGLSASGTVDGDTWVWDGAAWSSMPAPGPAAREGAAMATLDGMVVMNGGTDNTTVFADTWGWDGDSWSELATAGPEEYEAAMTAFGTTIVLSGWFDSDIVGSEAFNETELWNGSAWSKVSAYGPAQRQFPVMAATSSEAILFGGFDNGTAGGGVYADTWSWNGTAWSLLNVAGPPGRYGAAMASYTPTAGDP